MPRVCISCDAAPAGGLELPASRQVETVGPSKVVAKRRGMPLTTTKQFVDDEHSGKRAVRGMPLITRKQFVDDAGSAPGAADRASGASIANGNSGAM